VVHREEHVRPELGDRREQIAAVIGLFPAGVQVEEPEGRAQGGQGVEHLAHDEVAAAEHEHPGQGVAELGVGHAGEEVAPGWTLQGLEQAAVEGAVQALVEGRSHRQQGSAVVPAPGPQAFQDARRFALVQPEHARIGGEAFAAARGRQDGSLPVHHGQGRAAYGQGRLDAHAQARAEKNRQSVGLKGLEDEGPLGLRSAPAPEVPGLAVLAHGHVRQAAVLEEGSRVVGSGHGRMLGQRPSGLKPPGQLSRSQESQMAANSRSWRSGV
jgi:hypothetical protein